MEFRYTLNSVVLTEDDVLDYVQLEETIRREPTFQGLVNELLGDIRLINLGYDTLRTAITSNPCGEVTFLIERIEPDGTFTEDFDGKIILIGVKEDVLNCVFTTSIAGNDLSSRIANNIEALYFFRQTKSLDGSVTIANNAI